MISGRIKQLFAHTHAPRFTGLDILIYIGQGLLVTVGFIDPGNWAALVPAALTIFFSATLLQVLVVPQILLGIQLPLTIFL